MPEPSQRHCECANRGRLDLANMVSATRSPFTDLVWNTSALSPLPDSRIAAWAVEFLSRRTALAQRSQSTALSTSMGGAPTSGDHQPFFLAVGLHAGHAPFVVERHDVLADAAQAEQSLPFNMGEAVRDLEALTPEGKSIAAGRDAAQRSSTEDLAEHKRQSAALRNEATRRRIATERMSYLARLAETDHHIGFILDSVARRRALESSTMILLTADHGVHLGEKGVAVGAKWTLWEQTSRVPFILSIPPRLLSALPAGTSRNRFVHFAVSLVDVVPTLLDFSGSSFPSGVNFAGTSLLPMLSGQRSPGTHLSNRSVLITHCPSRRVLGYAVRNERYRYVSYQSKARGTPAGHRWATVKEAAGAGAELFDLVSDPGEKYNLLKLPSSTQYVHVERQWGVMERSLQTLLTGLPGG